MSEKINWEEKNLEELKRKKEKIKWSTIIMVIAVLYLLSRGIGYMVAISYGNPFGDIIFMVAIFFIAGCIGLNEDRNTNHEDKQNNRLKKAYDKSINVSD